MIRREDRHLKYPSPRQFTDFFHGLPRWVIPLILFLLFGRFVLVLIFELFF